MRVISTQIPTILEEQQNKKSPENTGFSGLFVFCFFISSRTEAFVFQHFLSLFVSYKCHMETHPHILQRPLLPLKDAQYTDNLSHFYFNLHAKRANLHGSVQVAVK